MKRIINNRLFDTDTAQLISSYFSKLLEKHKTMQTGF